MNFDWKHLAAAVLGALLSLGIGIAAKNGIEVPCPSAVIQSGGK
jgi:hypothetical protein